MTNTTHRTITSPTPHCECGWAPSNPNARRALTTVNQHVARERQALTTAR